MVYGPIAAALVEMFPTNIRYTSMSLPYHIRHGWFGGFLPTTAFAMVAATGNIYYGLWYPIVVAPRDGGSGLPAGQGRQGRGSERLRLLPPERLGRVGLRTGPPFSYEPSFSLRDRLEGHLDDRDVRLCDPVAGRRLYDGAVRHRLARRAECSLELRSAVRAVGLRSVTGHLLHLLDLLRRGRHGGARRWEYVAIYLGPIIGVVVLFPICAGSRRPPSARTSARSPTSSRRATARARPWGPWSPASPSSAPMPYIALQLKSLSMAWRLVTEGTPVADLNS